MNSAAAALVSAASIAALLGVYSAAVGSEVRIAGEAADMVSSLAAASNEALSASYDAASRSVEVRNHGPAPARLFMVDVVAPGGAGVRIALAPDRYAAPPGMAVVNGSAAGAGGEAASREVAPGRAVRIPLGGALAAAAGPSGAAPHPASAAVATDAGTRIVVGGLPVPVAAVFPASRGGGPGGGENGTATINGMGINSRIVHAWHGGFAVTGTGTVGQTVVPAGPYVESGGAPGSFVGVVLGGDRSRPVAVPSLSGSYSAGPGGSIARDAAGVGAAAAPVPLAYASHRSLEGSPSVSRGAQDEGLQLRGPGRIVLALHAYERGSALFLSGSASGGAELFVGPSPYDLASQAYAAGRGFEVWRGPAAGPAHSWMDSPCPPSGRAGFSASYWWDAPSVPVGQRGRASHGASAAANNNLPDPGTGSRGEPLMPASGRIEYGPGGGGLYRAAEGLSMASGSSPQLNGPAGCRMRPADVVPSIYDEVPIAEALAVVPGGSGGDGGRRFEAVLPAPEAGAGGGGGGGTVYALVHLDGPSDAVSLLARQISPGEALLSVSGLPPSVPYRMASGGAALAAGVTSGAGGISLSAADIGLGRGAGPAMPHCGGTGGAACPAAPAGAGAGAGAVAAAESAARPPGAVLHLYEGSFAVRGPIAGIVAYDPLNNASFSAPARPGSAVYVVHAWARIPVVGSVDVSGTALNGTLALPFVDGERGGGGGAGAAAVPEHVHVPVVPGYSHVAMSVNSVRAALAFADAAASGGGGAGAGTVRILAPSSSSAAVSDPGGPVMRVSAQAGAPSAHVAPRDGMLGAVFAAQVSGSARMDNTYALQGAGGGGGGGGGGWQFNASAAASGPPRGWQPGAPVSAFVEVRVNGEPAGVVRLYGGGEGGSGQEEEAYRSSAGAGSVLESIVHGPLVRDMRGSASVPVRAGDLVEFAVLVNATGTAPAYVPPAGAEVARSTGSASAAASLLSGTIIAGM